MELCLKLWTYKISPRHSDRRNVFQLSSRKVDAQSVINRFRFYTVSLKLEPIPVSF